MEWLKQFRSVFLDRLNKPWKRLVFLVIWIPLFLLTVIFSVWAAYYYYQANFPDDYPLYVCHQRFVEKELGKIPTIDNKIDLNEVTRRMGIRSERMNNRSRPDVREIENSAVFRDCLSNSYLHDYLINYPWLLAEAFKFFFWTLMVGIVIFFSNLFYAVYRITVLKAWRWIKAAQ